MLDYMRGNSKRKVRQDLKTDKHSQERLKS